MHSSQLIKNRDWDQFKKIADLTENEFLSLKLMLEVLKKPAPTGKVEMQTNNLKLDEYSMTLSELMSSIDLEKGRLIRRNEKIFKEEYESRRAFISEKEARKSVKAPEYETNEESISIIKVWMEHLERIHWILKARGEKLRTTSPTEH